MHPFACREKMASSPSIEIPAPTEDFEKPSSETITAVFSEASSLQKEECILLASAQFCFPLTPEQCAERDRQLDTFTSTQGPAWRFWCVYNKDDPNEILASCRTLERLLSVHEPGRQVRDGKGYCISAVVTNQRYRKRGLATFLLDNVTKWMDGAGEAELGFLYTGLTKFYEPQGWHVQPSSHLLILATSLSKVDKHSLGLPTSEPLSQDDLSHSVCEHHVANSAIKLGSPLSTADSSPKKTFVAIQPTYELTHFLYRRVDLMNKALHAKVPKVNGSTCNHIRLFWVHDIKAGQLIIHGSSYALPPNPNDDTVKAVMSLLLDATEAAKEWGLDQVAVWNPEPCMKLAAERLEALVPGLEARVEEREWNVAMMRARGGDRRREYVFEQNEYYAWN